MADKDREDNRSLELPSFGFGRKKSKGKPSEPAAAPSEGAPPAPGDPTPDPTPDPIFPPPVAPELDSVTPEPDPAPGIPQTLVEPDVRPAPFPSSREETRPLPSPTAQVTSTEDDKPPAEPEPKREFSFPSTPAFPAIPVLRAVLIVGVIIGMLGVLLTFASLKFCELARGTDSCGAPGLLLLIATVVMLTYVGAWLLRGFGVADPGSTSFLAVGLLAVMVMVFFLDVIYNWWMILVIPPVSMAMYALSWWVTTSFVEADDGRS